MVLDNVYELIARHIVVEVVTGRVESVREGGTRIDVDDWHTGTRENSSHLPRAIADLDLVHACSD